MSNDFQLEHMIVLLVDDHAPIRKALKRILTKMRFKEIIESFDGEHALKELDENPIDLVLCDIYVRKVNGFEILSYLRNREIGSDIPCIIVTGEASKDDIVKASDIGANDYILKPFQAEQVESKVKQVLTQFHSPSKLVQKLREADKLLLSKDFNNALLAYEEAKAIDPESHLAKYSYALALTHCNRTDEAFKIFKKNIREAPSFYKNYATIANLYLEKKEFSKAIPFIRKELELNAKQPERRRKLAHLLLQQGDALGAVEQFRRTLQDDNKNKSALMGAGFAFAKSNDLEKALYYFKRARRVFPDDTSTLKGAIKVCRQLGKEKKIEILLRDEKKAHPERLDTYILLAKYYLSEKNISSAQSVLEELFSRSKDHLEGLKLQAFLKLKEKKYDDAFNIYEKIAKKDPSIENYIMLAESLLMMKRVKDAVTVLHKIIIKNPSCLPAFDLLARSYRKSKQYMKALFVYKKVEKLGKLKPESEKALKICLNKIGEKRKI